MRKTVTITLAFLLLTVAGASARCIIWNSYHLDQVKKSLSDSFYAPAYKRLIGQADAYLRLPLLSVTFKEKTPPSGDKHDYMSQARYYWPDPTKPDGKPYVNRDGESNPELDKLDRNRLGELGERVSALSLAYYLGGDEKYAAKATELIRAWFFDSKTRMNPNFEYAQMIPGHNDDKGRCYGVIDAYSFVEMLDGVNLLEGSKSFTAKDSQRLKAWFAEFLRWILTSPQGQEEGRQKNNHSVAHDAQVIAFAMYCDSTQIAKRYINDFPKTRLFPQVALDGSQPNELWRTLAFGYSVYNITHMIDIFSMAKNLGMELRPLTNIDGHDFYKAVDFLTPYLGEGSRDWKYKQISDWDGRQQQFCKDLYRVNAFYNHGDKYVLLYKGYNTTPASDRFNLLFVNKDDMDKISVIPM